MFRYSISEVRLKTFFVIRTLFQVIYMLKNIARHPARCQISGSQCYDSRLPFNQRKHFMNFEYENKILNFVFRFSLFELKHFASKSSLAFHPISNISFF